MRGLGVRVERMHIFALIGKLKQVCNFTSDKRKSAKLDWVLETVQTLKDEGAKVLMFSQYREYGIRALEKPLRKFGVVKYTSEMSQKQRDDAVREFQEDQDKTVFLSTLKTGGLGISLTAASYVIHFDHWWNPAVMRQAEDRAHRIGQKSEERVTVYRLWTKDTIEQRIYKILERKEKLFTEVVDSMSDKGLARLVTDEELYGLLGLDDLLEAKKKAKPKEEVPAKELSVGDIYERLNRLEPRKFEEIIADLFQALGYKVKTTRFTRDGGIDIFAAPVRIVAFCAEADR